MVVTLEFIDGPFPPNKKSVSLTQGESVRIGRLSLCDIFVPDPAISGKHFLLDVKSDQPKLTDLGSRNGTQVNGAKTTSSPLSDGDEILAGKTRFRVVVVNDSANPNEPRNDSWVFYPGKSPLEQTPSPAPENGAFDDSMFESLDVHSPLGEMAFSLDANAAIDLSGVNFDSVDEIGQINGLAPTQEEVKNDFLKPTNFSSTGTLRSIPLSVLIEVSTSAGVEDEIRIRSGQVVAIGSSSSADFSFSNCRLRPRHFKINCNHNGVTLQCFDQQWPVEVNGQNQMECRLFDKDKLSAGNAIFDITLQGDQNIISRPLDEPRTEILASTSQPALRPKPKTKTCNANAIQFNSPMNKSVRLEGEIEAFAMIKVLSLLQSKFKAYLLVDFFRMGDSRFPTTEQKPFRVSESATAGVGAFLIPVDGLEELEKWSEKIEGSDCGAFLCSSLDHDAFRNQIRSIAAKGQPVFNVCWPSVMRVILSSGSAKIVNQFIETASFVVMESESAEHWAIFCSEKNANELPKLGLDIQPESKVQEETSHA